MEEVTILLAEDEAMLLLDFENALTDAGFHVRAVTNSGKAIEILRSADLPILGVVTDIRFGELPDGWEVARIAREIDPDISIVYISGHGAVDWPSRGVPDSIMIEKPFTSAQLVTAVSHARRPPSSERCLTAEMTRARPVNHQLPSCVARPSMARLVHRYQPPGDKLEFGRIAKIGAAA